MNYYYISGTSRGIGKAMAEEVLKNENNYVIGFSRTNSIKHERFEFIPIDLLHPDEAKHFRFIKIIDAESICLINNSGMIGSVEHLGKCDNQSIIDTFMVNTISPAILTNNFINAYHDFSCKKVIVNISSGAARYPIESWSTYCSSKSALDMFSTVGQLEQDLIKSKYPYKFFSVAPGIVDTKMQDEIRDVNETSFSDVGRFIKYKAENKLIKPVDVAQKLCKLIENSDNVQQVLIDLREIDL